MTKNTKGTRQRFSCHDGRVSGSSYHLDSETTGESATHGGDVTACSCERNLIWRRGRHRISISVHAQCLAW